MTESPFLVDAEISEIVRAGCILHARDVEPHDTAKSAIQAGSFDLSIGRIFLPGLERDVSGGILNAKIRHNLRPGETAVVETAEELQFTTELAAFGFPPAHISSAGILMTNPGHVDPGYHGMLRFTIINMGRQEYVLESGARICTLLIYRSSKPTADYKARHHELEQATFPNVRGLREMLESLSSDFLNVDERAKKAALAQLPWWTVMGAGLVAIGTIVAAVSGFLGDTRGLRLELVQANQKLESQLDVRMTVLEERLKNAQDLTTLDNRIKVLEEAGGAK